MFFIMNLLFSLHQASRQTFEKEKYENYDDSSKEKLVLRSGFYCGINLVGIYTYQLIITSSWIWGLINIIVFSLINIIFLNNTGQLKILTIEYTGFALAGAITISYFLYKNIKKTKMIILNREKISKMQNDSAILLNHLPDGIIIYKETPDDYSSENVEIQGINNTFKQMFKKVDKAPLSKSQFFGFNKFG